MSEAIYDSIFDCESTYIIAEIGNNHNGDVDLAKEMTLSAVRAGADCVKFQMRDLERVYRSKSLRRTGDDLGTEYVLDLLDRFELTIEEHRILFEFCREVGVDYMCTPWDSGSLQVLESFGAEKYKVASADLTNLMLLKDLIATGKPLILSTGMSTLDEVKTTVNLLKEANTDFCLLHCNSAYPAPFRDINLKWITTMREQVHPVIGYSGHERGLAVSLAAVALGAKVIERHFTFSREMEGPDHAASLEPEEFARLVDGVREIELAMGDGRKRYVSQGEMINRENLSKSLVASKKILKGQVIKEDSIQVKSPGLGLSPQFYNQLIGKIAKRDLDYEDYFFMSDLESVGVTARKFQFSRKWGIPVRFHDYKTFSETAKSSLYEFHLSYTDMLLDPADYIETNQTADFVVHAPELLSGSRLMDLTLEAGDETDRQIIETQRVIDLSRKIKELFPACETPPIVANIGGFTMDAPLPAREIEERYENFANNLKKLDLEGVELIPQTMAPFPWHFGGQRFQNLFVHADECVRWCKTLGLRMCLDVSHSHLAAEHFGFDFYEFVETVAPYTAHLHLGDAKGVGGEGLQIGEGDIDFGKLFEILDLYCPDASFIPEIWQGHKDSGRGFWIALDKLEKLATGAVVDGDF